jgi:hypothetical protein
LQRLFVHIFQLLSTAGELDQTWYQARFFETLCTLFLILVLLVDVFILYRESNHKYVNSYQNSIRDPLTRLYNRSFFYDTLNQQLAKVNAQHPLSVIISDLDHFKRINDNYGHVAGDKVIQFAASVLESHSRRMTPPPALAVRSLPCCWSTPQRKKRRRSPSVSAWRSAPSRALCRSE